MKLKICQGLSYNSATQSGCTNVAPEPPWVTNKLHFINANELSPFQSESPQRSACMLQFGRLCLTAFGIVLGS